MSARILLLCGLTTLCGLLVALAQQPGSDSTTWQEVRQAMDIGQPKTALEKLEPILQKSLQEGNDDAAVRAIALKVVLEGSIQGNQPAERVTRLKTQIQQAPERLQPVLHAILAHWYWHYFQQNRWRFASRTEVDQASQQSDDFTTWDLPQILGEVDKHFQVALGAEAALKQIKASDYDEFLEKGTVGDKYRPTLYDVIADSALGFYAAGEQAGSKAQNAFELRVDSPIFDEAAKFLKWQPELAESDQSSPHARAIKLYQDLLRFHANDADQTAYLDWDLARYRFGFNVAVGEDKNDRYRAAMERFSKTNSEHPSSSRSLHAWAEVVHGENDLVEAHRLATEGLKRHPKSVGAQRCFNLIQSIEAKSSSITCERVWNDPWPTIDVTYRNIDRVYFRLVRYDYALRLSDTGGSLDNLDRSQRKRLIATQPSRTWSANLPATENYQQRTESVDVPKDIPFGSYWLIASHNEEFAETENSISVTRIWRSDLAMVLRNYSGTSVLGGIVTQAESGQPLDNVKVEAWQSLNNRSFELTQQTSTDGAGEFRFSKRTNQSTLFIARHGQDVLPSLHRPAAYPDRVPRDNTNRQTIFFTDRAIYRPGQTISYKGICYSSNQSTDRYVTLARQKLSVVFTDANGQEIERRQHVSNDFGSFAGTFTAPRDRLMGRMSISVDDQPGGSTSIRVEEYKRPKFRVEVKDPTATTKLGDQVTVSGKATAYTGVAIDGAKVAYRVVRNVNYAPWWYWRCWWMPVQPPTPQEIASGTTTTDALGRFEVTFLARPDESVAKESEPQFTFTVYADVTDTTGETRSDQGGISLGYSAISASMSTDHWLTSNDPTSIKVQVAGLFGDQATATGTVKVHRLQQPQQVARAALSGSRYNFGNSSPSKPDPGNPNSWELGEAVGSQRFQTAPSGETELKFDLESGIYRAMLETTDGEGNKATATVQFQVIDPESDRLNIKIPYQLIAPQWSVLPGETFTAIWGSGYESARVLVEIEHRGRTIRKYWTDADRTQGKITVPVNENMRGGFTLRTTMVRENRAYLTSRQVEVPWVNKQFDIKWERFVSKLRPATEETWTAIIQTKPDIKGNTQAAIAEMVATLYDASLDAFVRHSFGNLSYIFRRDYSRVSSMFENQQYSLRSLYQNWPAERRDGSLTYWHLPDELTTTVWQDRFLRRRGMEMAFGGTAMQRSSAVPAMAPMMNMAMAGDDMFGESPESEAKAASMDAASVEEKSDGATNLELDQVSARTNLNETAFFFPSLVSGEDGTVKMTFTMPEALTEWKFIGFAHDRNLRSGSLGGTTVTAKDLMVQPNAPRFLREGDEIEFTVKVSNQSATQQTGTVRLSFADARTGDSVDAKLANAQADKTFEIPAGQSQTLSWKLKVADSLGVLTYRAVGSTGRLSDGEEGYLPVLSRRVLVQESLSLPIRGQQAKTFDFEKLLRSGESDSIQHQSLTVQMVSNPAWYAVMALPYLMEYPHECSEQTFNRFYANMLAQHIVSSDPKIERVFQQWRATPALDSPLEKNEDLKSVLIQESPWQRQAKSESQSRRDVGLLFDQNRLNDEMNRALAKLTQMQLESGAWPWFDGGRANEYLTLYITTGFGRLRHLGVPLDPAPAITSLTFLDDWMARKYRDIKQSDRDRNHLSTTVALYLYGRSFFLKDQPIADDHRTAFAYWRAQAKKYWLELNQRQSKAQLAVSLHRLGENETARLIMTSIKQHSVSEQEMGMYWRDTELSWWWYRAPIETQAMMIEAFDEVMNDQQAVEDCKVWMLKQKQTQAWKTTKSTADAIYALLLRGSDLLASDELVEVSLAGEVIEPVDVEAGTGFYQQRIMGENVEPAMGEIKVRKVDPGVAWGSVHWQYLEDLGKVTPHDGNPLKLTKQLYVKKTTPQGPKLIRVDGAIEVGDELVVRLVLRTDRDMEFVHLKDHRGSGTEPVNVLSQYRFQDGLAYYESTRDTASHFFIDYLPKGTYVFEYSTRVQLRGQYQTGFAHIECMYAPEFDAHSKSLGLLVE